MITLKELDREVDKVLKLKDTLDKTFNNDDESHLKLAIIAGLKDAWNRGYDKCVMNSKEINKVNK